MSYLEIEKDVFDKYTEMVGQVEQFKWMAMQAVFHCDVVGQIDALKELAEGLEQLAETTRLAAKELERRRK